LLIAGNRVKMTSSGKSGFGVSDVYMWYFKRSEVFDDSEVATERLSSALADDRCNNKEQQMVI
jgi:hypothetical protein